MLAALQGHSDLQESTQGWDWHPAMLQQALGRIAVQLLLQTPLEAHCPWQEPRSHAASLLQHLLVGCDGIDSS